MRTSNAAGQRIGKVEDTQDGGNGTYTRNGFIYSSLAGHLRPRESEDGKV